MYKEVNVINKAEKDLDVTINNIGGNIQIVINMKKEDIDLLSLKAGEIFEVNNVEYIALEQLPNNQTVVIKKESLEDGMKFGDDNNWKTSDVREKLNSDYLRELEEVFGKDRIVEHTVDLLSLDGLDDYGMSKDKVSLFTINQYRKYRKVLGGNLNKPWWLATPDSTPSGNSSRYVLCVFSGGNVDYVGCDWDDGGVRPFFILQS